MVSTNTTTHTYTATDIEIVVRRFAADLIMIAQSSGAISQDTAHDYAHDVELLAKNRYLRQVDLSLLSGFTEVRAVQYVVTTAAGNLSMSRPGNVLWPRVTSPYFRITLSYNATYSEDARQGMRGKLRVNWTPTSADLSHATLQSTGGRDYASNGWGLQRKDYSS